LTHELAPNRRAYLFIINGSLGINGKTLSSGDQATIENESKLELRPIKPVDLILLDLP